MSYNLGQPSSAPVGVPSLISDSGSIVERLSKIHSHMIEVGLKLHGSEPRDTRSPSAQAEPEPTVRRNLDRAFSWLNENEFQHIDARL